MQAEVAKWSKRDCQKLRNLPGLMQLLQAEALPEADQPEVIAGNITIGNSNFLFLRLGFVRWGWGEDCSVYTRTERNHLSEC